MEQREDRFWCTRTEMELQNTTIEMNGELSLPDYLGEISRLLRVWPRVLPPRCFVSGGNAEFSGRVCYDVLYAGADGRLYHTDMEDTYTFSVPLQGEGAEPCAFLVPDVVVGRVAAPRRLSVRCRMHAQVGVYQRAAVGVTLSPEEQERVCVLGDTVPCGRHFSTVGDTLVLQESFDVQEKSLAVILSRGEVFLPEVTALHDGVRCRGEVCLTLLCCEETEENTQEAFCPFTVSRRLPFFVEMPMEGVSGEDSVRAVGSVESIRTTVEGNRISLSVGIVVQAEAVGRETKCFIKDLFLPYMQSECRATLQKSWVPTVCKNQNYSLGATPTLAEAGLPAGAEVVDACADAEIGEKAAKNGSITVRGDVHCHLLYRLGHEWGVGEVKIPFAVTQDGEFDTLSVLASVPICRVQQEDDRVRLTPELVLSCLGNAHQSFMPVQEVKFSPLPDMTRCDVEFYYPAGDETVWSVARRFALPPDRLAAANGLDTDDLGAAATSDAGYLMLPQNEK